MFMQFQSKIQWVSFSNNANEICFIKRFVSAANTAKGLDATLIRELEETRRAVQEAKALFSKDNQMGRYNCLNQ